MKLINISNPDLLTTSTPEQMIAVDKISQVVLARHKVSAGKIRVFVGDHYDECIFISFQTAREVYHNLRAWLVNGESGVFYMEDESMML